MMMTTTSRPESPLPFVPARSNGSSDDRSGSETYRRVAAAIRFLDDHQGRQPELAEVAAAAGLSPTHFQRLFRRWAGISPKRFLQHLTVEAAKGRLDQDVPVLETAWDVGLSSPGRLHDHFVSLEAVTPGEYKAGGDSLDMVWGLHDSPFGEVLVAATERGICRLAFTDAETVDEVAAQLERRWSRSTLRRDDAAVRPWAERALARNERTPLLVQGTNFQIQVWRALLRVPAGSLISYGRLAETAGSPGGSRAVGSAVGANPVAMLIPCHRVLRADGSPGGYRWGGVRKRALVACEGARTATR
ncbi:MAG: methylated-DNA--[protein]-cysteine S-methyltransferase [Acidobacteriota bacterium]